MNWKVAITYDGVELYSLFEGGGPVIRERKEGGFDLIGVPQYGGDEIFYGTFTHLLDAMKKAETFT